MALLPSGRVLRILIAPVPFLNSDRWPPRLALAFVRAQRGWPGSNERVVASINNATTQAHQIGYEVWNVERDPLLQPGGCCSSVIDARAGPSVGRGRQSEAEGARPSPAAFPCV